MEALIAARESAMGAVWLITKENITVEEHLNIFCLNASYSTPYQNVFQLSATNIFQLFGIKIPKRNAFVQVVSFADGTPIPTGMYQVTEAIRDGLTTIPDIRTNMIAKKEAEQGEKKPEKTKWVSPTSYGQAYEMGGLDYAEEGNWSKPPFQEKIKFDD